MSRPEGQPGTVWAGTERTILFPWPDILQTVRTGLSYPAVMADDGTLSLWRDGQWIESPGYATFFERGEEWQADCTHDGLVPWKGCDTEADCLALRRDEARREAGER